MECVLGKHRLVDSDIAPTVDDMTDIKRNVDLLSHTISEIYTMVKALPGQLRQLHDHDIPRWIALLPHQDDEPASFFQRVKQAATHHTVDRFRDQYDLYLLCEASLLGEGTAATCSCTQPYVVSLPTKPAKALLKAFKVLATIASGVAAVASGVKIPVPHLLGDDKAKDVQAFLDGAKRNATSVGDTMTKISRAAEKALVPNGGSTLTVPRDSPADPSHQQLVGEAYCEMRKYLMEHTSWASDHAGLVREYQHVNQDPDSGSGIAEFVWVCQSHSLQGAWGDTSTTAATPPDPNKCASCDTVPGVAGWFADRNIVLCSCGRLVCKKCLVRHRQPRTCERCAPTVVAGADGADVGDGMDSTGPAGAGGTEPAGAGVIEPAGVAAAAAAPAVTTTTGVTADGDVVSVSWL
eukprot:m.183860 g.183860  ORF g.183860 m.183860 type:complete len:408 (-) comp18088_c0_seq1:3535-4758(-)